MIKRFNLYKEGNYKTDSELSVRFLAPVDFKYIETKKETFWKLLGEMVVGNRCLALIENGVVLSYLWINSNFTHYYGLKKALLKNECYLYNAITKPEERGKGYAEVLRAKCYEILRKQGKDTFYSITDLDNVSAMRFKDKIGAEIIGSYKYYKIWKFEKLCATVRNENHRKDNA